MAMQTHDVARYTAGNEFAVELQADFVDLYATGGALLDLPLLTGLRNINQVSIESQAGYDFVYDRANKKLLAYQGSGSHNHVFTGSLMGTHNHDLVPTIDEVVTITAHVGAALAHLPAAISMVYGIGGTAGPKAIVPTGVAPAAGQCSVNWATGVITFEATDNNTSAKVTYVQKLAGADLGSAGTPAGTNAAFAGGAETEVANGTDLSALKNVRIRVLGT